MDGSERAAETCYRTLSGMVQANFGRPRLFEGVFSFATRPLDARLLRYSVLTKNIVRIQAETHPENVASQRVLEKAGFKKEGIIRKSLFSRRIWRDTAMFSILREEWKEPKILKKTASR
jgi:hypothetical protein